MANTLAGRPPSTLLAAALLAGLPTAALAQTPAEPPGDEPRAPPRYRTTVRTTRPRPPDTVEGRATHQTSKRQMQQRQVRSAPDALRYVPGVYVQQTAHGQGSPYVRGLTGRRTLLLFDGLRLNNALFRQGPNQILFTVDTRTIDRLEVVRGSAAVELGAGALGGAILVHPIEPRIDPGRGGLSLTPKLAYRRTTADDEAGFRAQIDAQLGSATGLLAGVGYRTAGQLEAAGPVSGLEPWPSEEARLRWEVPRFEADGRTQMGTGFEEMTADARLLHRLSDDERLVAATYVYRQLGSPRTDQCPPPEAPDDWCLVYEEQFRTHAYAKAELLPGWAALEALDAWLSFSRQHERRRNEQVFVNGGIDDIDVWEARLRGRTAALALTDWLRVSLLYGLDGTWESVSSRRWTILDFSRVLPESDTVVVEHLSRGQYTDGGRFLQGGVAWTSARLELGDSLTLRAGGRAAAASALAPEDLESDTLEVDGAWTSLVGQAGAEWRVLDRLSLLASLAQAFRPPNLDDLTARQVTGQGFQIENPGLVPERTTTAEVGVRWSGDRLAAEVWAFQTLGLHWMDRRDAECPPALARTCDAARWASPVQLVNLPGTAIIHGAEAQARLRLPFGLSARGTLAWTWGEGDSPLAHEAGERRPLSRIPPLNGTLEAEWRHRPTGLYAGAGVHWAAGQDRLSYGDDNDKRIPWGGTPGHVVCDLRGGLQVRRWLTVNAVLENLFDEAWRSHGSSVNGAGRGLHENVEIEM